MNLCLWCGDPMDEDANVVCAACLEFTSDTDIAEALRELNELHSGAQA